MAESSDEVFSRSLNLCETVTRRARRGELVLEKLPDDNETPIKAPKKRKSVSFKIEPQVIQLVLQEGAEEHLSRVFGFSSEDQPRVKTSELLPMREFLERSARAMGFLNIYLDGRRFGHEDADRWRRFGEDGSMAVDDVNETLPRSLGGWKFSQEQIDKLVQVHEALPGHTFVDDGTSCMCATCLKTQSAW
eukprot:CAMPEP_0171491886 /NCGR_PEP_ID=MMETSP0958-20121227/4104_1 /TAXON_ID=87120 /ORGANISM="Aurantiochytrium limacinum, Strain ATCCMYA-1381" /LENGTH=190 /DNA_ID=CAMNT_0012025345 /DNA_START=93 /DNA_END=662 /DNA_ORIENTATION=+